MSEPKLVKKAEPFLNYLDTWLPSLPIAAAGEVFRDPDRCAVVSVDVIKGFCSIGPLSSPRVALIVEPIVRLFRSAWESGVRHILLTQDSHEPDAKEFSAWPAHCVRGTEEAETVDAFKELPFFDQMVVMPKNSIQPGLNTGLGDWVPAHPEIETYVVTGDCTDLCTYQLAMYLRLDANSRQLQRRVIVPIDCVDTYDLSVDTARENGGMPHPADLLHATFLYHMALNGVEVVSRIE